LLDRLSKLSQADAVAEELFLSVLTRRPTDEERKDVAAYLQGHAENRTAALGDLAWALLTSAEFAAYLQGHAENRTAALGDLAWALLTSAEFRFNH
jgi:hypothetical protein